MKVNFLLLSLALHVVLLSTPLTRVERTEDRPMPITIVVEPKNPQAHTSSVPHLPINRASYSIRKPVKPAHAQKVTSAGNALSETSKSKEKTPQQEVLASVAPDILDPEVEADSFDSLNLSAPSPKTPSNPPPHFGDKVAENKKTTPDEHVAARDQETPFARNPMALRANYSYAPKPEYPTQARREGWEGTVLLAILVDAEGRPARITLSRSSGFASLDSAAQETVKQWRFSPARNGRQRVESWVKVPIVFTLAESKD